MGRISYETHFTTDREDGRFVCAMAGYMEYLRHLQPKLALPENLTSESYWKWREEFVSKYREILAMPEFTDQPAPKRISRVKRDTYTVEKWELYPDNYTVVPFLVLIPDGASKEHPVPGVICIPGACDSKEFVSGEPLPDIPNWSTVTWPEENQMGLYFVKNGMAAFVFDNTGTAETGVYSSDPNLDTFNGNSLNVLCCGYLFGGYNYHGMQVFQKLCLMQHLDLFEFLDRDKMAACSHSQGTSAALGLGIFCDEIKAVIYNNVLYDDKERFYIITEMEEGQMTNGVSTRHIIPGLVQYYTEPDICAALAPKYLAINEGGSDGCLEKVRRAYAAAGAQDKLQISYCPRYADPKARTMHETLYHGLSEDDYEDYSYCDIRSEVIDHHFRREPTLKLLKECFGMK